MIEDGAVNVFDARQMEFTSWTFPEDQGALAEFQDSSNANDKLCRVIVMGSYE